MTLSAIPVMDARGAAEPAVVSALAEPGRLRPMIPVPDTRLAMVANPQTGRMLLQGWGRDGPATAVPDLHQPCCGTV